MTLLTLPAVNRPFVAALQQIAETPGRWSVIGGIAVWSHLGESHRPTLDVDTAAAQGAHDALVSLGSPGTADHRRIVEGVKLEVIEVLDPGNELTELDEKSRLFIAGHWAAVEATVDREIRSADLAAVVPVARRLPLVACKLHAWLDRRDQAADKRGSDGLDLVRLLESADWDELAADAHADDHLRSSLRWATTNVLVDQATRVARMIQIHTDATPPSADDVRALGNLLLEQL